MTLLILKINMQTMEIDHILFIANCTRAAVKHVFSHVFTLKHSR